jgi:uncharacterized protein (DUF952 family)
MKSSMLKFRDILLGKEEGASDEASKPKKDAKKSEGAISEQMQEQQKKLVHLYRQLPCNPWNEETEKRLLGVLRNLQGTQLLDALRATFPEEKVEEWKEQSQREFDQMGKLNRARMESLIEIADEGMRQVVYESIFLFDVNPADHPNLEIVYKKGFDEETGKPKVIRDKYHVFPDKALYGISGIDRFLPEVSKAEGEGNWMAHLNEQFPDIIEPFGKNDKPMVQTLSTIGSLGGIGHKPDSDVDAQVIFGTEPRYEHNWNDADFFIAVLYSIIDQAYERFLQSFPAEKRAAFEEEAARDLLEECGDHLSEEEKKIVSMIFPSSYKLKVRKLSSEMIKKMDMGKQVQVFWSQIPVVLRKLPEAEMFSEALLHVFPFMRKLPPRKVQASCFPNAVPNLDEKAATVRLLNFYRDKVLGQRVFMKMLEKPAQAAGVDPAKVPASQQRALLLKHLQKNAKKAHILKQFLDHVAESYRWEVSQTIGDFYMDLMDAIGPTEEMQGLIQLEQLEQQALRHYHKRMTDLVSRRVEQEAIENEAEYEPGTHRKILIAEEYMLEKYPAQEAHYFVNILRKQRAGSHTPFLVSPEGSMAYANMLNDLLLNPATLLCGLSPMPFSLPDEVRILCNIGVFKEWNLTQTKETAEDDDPRNASANQETFRLRDLPNWGGYAPSRDTFLEYVIPIFLRESEKVSHRNLPKALLNTWWIEMLCCTENSAELTSLTKLLIFPNDRAFIAKEMTGDYVDAIKSMEEEFPQLVRDPWWTKFTEMLMRFEDPEVQKEMLFCFAQHVRVADVIDFDNNGEAIYLDKKSTWRFKAVHRFYTKFFVSSEDKINLMKFAQGRDDVAQEKEQQLKRLFLNSMKTVERTLISIGNKQTLHKLSQYVAQVTKNSDEKTRLAAVLTEPLDQLMDRMLIVDMGVMKKAEGGADLNVVEARQVAQIQDDRRKVNELAEMLAKHYAEKHDAKLNPMLIEKIVFQSRVQLAGDPLENVIFKFHFERNFNRRPFQVPLPISKSLCVPRSAILLEFEPKKEQWKFKSMITKSSGGSKGGNQLEMFQAPLTEGVARCVFSKYIGFDARMMTSFQKNAVQSRSLVATNTVTADDLQRLAGDIKDFFKSIRVRSRELLENIYYISDIMLVCNVDRYMMCSVIVRTNFDEQFVVTFDLNKTPAIEKDPGLSSSKNQMMHSFFQRFNSLPARLKYWETIRKLNVPMSTQHCPRFKIWVNPGGLNLSVTPKYQRVYLNGIAEKLWRPEHIWQAPAEDAHFPMVKDFDALGKEAIEEFQQHE